LKEALVNTTNGTVTILKSHPANTAQRTAPNSLVFWPKGDSLI
jgi:hypothetical protein